MCIDRGKRREITITVTWMTYITQDHNTSTNEVNDERERETSGEHLKTTN